jgi:hypothetical protein
MAIWNILQTFGIFYDQMYHLVHFVLIWYIFPVWVLWTDRNLSTLVETGVENVFNYFPAVVFAPIFFVQNTCEM